MPQALNIAGNKYGRLTVIEASGKNRHGQALWRCMCDCGNTIVAQGGGLRSGTTKSCGCYRNSLVAARRTTHGASSGYKEDASYTVWKAMRQRCLNPNSQDWAYYGGRGIKICQPWLDDYRAFLADMGDRPRGYTIERLDHNGDYEPSNCAWATRKQQSRNTRQTHRITLCGELVPLVVACERFGLNYASVKVRRLKRRLGPTEAFYTFLEKKYLAEGVAI